MSSSPEGRLYVLRHGETEWSRDGRHTSHTDLALTEHGDEQARTAGRLLHVLRGDQPAPVVWCSPLRRARDTARLAGLEVDDDPAGTSAVRDDLVEWDYGDYEGRTTPDIRTEDPGWTVWTHPSPGGETADEVGARADRVLADAGKVLAERDVVLVGHGHASRVLIARYVGLDPRSGVDFAFDPASVTVLGHGRGVPRIDLLNIPGGLVSPPPPPADRH